MVSLEGVRVEVSLGCRADEGADLVHHCVACGNRLCELGLECVKVAELIESSFEYLGAGGGGLGAGLQQAFHQVITRRATCVFAGGGGTHNLVDLVPVHVRLLGKRLAHRHERGGDRGTPGPLKPLESVEILTVPPVGDNKKLSGETRRQASQRKEERT